MTVYRYEDEELDFPHQTRGHRAKRPLPRRDIIQQARRQAQQEVKQQRPTRSIPRQEIADDLPDYEDEWEVPRMPAVTRRYDLTPGEYYHQPPLRRSAPVTQTPAAPTPRFKVHWFVYVGIAFILVLIGLMAYGPITTAWQAHTDDVTYGTPRTFQVDAVVGHSDSSSNPSHFIAENLQGHIIVIEIPGGDLSKSRSYSITTEAGGDASVPVKVTFQDINGDGKLDMVVQVGDPGNVVTFTFYNDGTQFTSKP